ncbi:MAG: shikimate kinase [Candidatus Methanomethylophilaceae archaeon]
MTGKGRSHSAISVINAIPCGIGAVIGTELRTEAEFHLGDDALRVDIENDPQADDRLARVCVLRTLESLGMEERGGMLRVDSEIPISRGLKSSSAAANAIVQAVCSAVGAEMGRMEMVHLGVRCALEAGVTVTGAFDDACGCMFGGFVMTDNTRRQVIFADDFEPMDVIIHVPAARIEKKDGRITRLDTLRDRMPALLQLAMRDPLAALTVNGRLVAEAMGLDDSVADAAMLHGASAAGITGTGPAVAIVTQAGEGNKLKETMGLDEAMITRTRRQEHGAGI